MSTSIRQATPGDANIVAELVGELLAEIMITIGTPAFNFDLGETTQRARQFIECGIYTVLIASEESTQADIGLVTLCENHALYAEGTFGTIPEFYVRPAHRTKGVGRLLLDSARKIATSKDWKRLEVATPPLPAFDRTMRFYENNGFSMTGGRKLKSVL